MAHETDPGQEPPAPPHSERTRTSRAFWDRSAEWDVHRAIWDSAALRDEAAREQAFDESGADDARALVAHVGPDSRVVDLGCGIGRVMRPLAPLCREIIGVDISAKMIEMGRAYLGGVPNARLVHTSGAALPGVADGSVDFLYSLICLIHVDKRTAFRYLREIERVLTPGGMALVQVENLMSPGGLAEFRRVVDLTEEYPLEFYTADELRWLARAVGLEVLHSYEDREFLFATLFRGSREEWIRRVNEGISVDPRAATGLFVGNGTEGHIEAEIVSRLTEPLSLRFHGALSRRDAPAGLVYRLDGQVRLAAGGRHRVEIHHEPGGVARVLLDGRPLPLFVCERGGASPEGPLRFTASLTPPGFPNTPETERLFPALYPSMPSGEGSRGAR